MEKKDYLTTDPEKIRNESVTTKSSMPLIAGVILLIGGALALIDWFSLFSIDTATLESSGVLSQLRQAMPSVTAEQALGFFRTCAVIGCIISVFMVLGGLLSIKRKLWGISLACSIIGLFSIGIFFSSSLLSLVALILLLISRKEF